MDPARWALINEVFAAALERSGASRESFLVQRCGGDAALRREVDSLLASDAAAGAFLETPALAQAPRAAGERLGAWVLERQLGHGGMGEVWLASRADGAYQQRAALKLVRPHFDDGTLARRFLAERQILATLTHPNIARLLDGGTAPDGSPWFAMEYVEGEPLDAWCRARALSSRARVELLLRVCDAVSEAHRHLIVHRDLKPANVLVTRDGEPRLLDFGIARLLGDDAAHLTQRGLALTPAWASPEQIRGEPVTTASDVFSLGVILYELLTGHRPWGAVETPEATLRAVLDVEPQPTGLEADLDAVVRKALEKDLINRYPSVDALAQDLTRWLDGHPVSARAPSLPQRLGKAVRRNRALSALGAAVFLSMAGGLVATTWQARIAQKRLDAVRALANTLIFEVHDAVLYVPGATEARTIITRKAVAYLDELARDTRDPAMRREVVAGYQKVAEASNYASAANLGDAQGATQNYEKALALLEAPGSAPDASVEDRAALASLWLSYGTHLLEVGELARARDSVQRGLAARRQLLAGAPTDPERRRDVANAASYLADVEKEAGDLAAALAGYELVREVYTALVAADPTSAKNRWGLVCGYSNTAEALARLGQLDEARARLEKALALCEALRVDRPDHYTVLQGLGAFQHQLGELHLAAGARDQARLAFEAARTWRGALVARDAHDVEAAMALARTEGELATFLPMAQAQARFAALQARLDELEATRPGHRRLAVVRAELALREEGDEACRHLARARVALAALSPAQRQVPETQRLAAALEARLAVCPGAWPLPGVP